MHIINKLKPTGQTAEKSGTVKFHVDKRAKDIFGRVLPPAVAMVQACISHYRQAYRPLKCVYLNERLFKQFEYWYRSMLKEEEADATVGLITMYDVEVKKGSPMAKDEMYWDFWPEKPIAQA